MKWKSVNLSDICRADSPITYGILQPGPDVEDGIPYVRPSEIKNGTIDVASIRHTTPQIASRYRKSIIREGDLLITIVGTIGHIATVPSELNGGNITQSSARIRIDLSKADQSYVKNYLRSTYAERQYAQHKLGVAVPRLNLHHVRDLQVPLPSLAEQKRIATILDKANAIRRKRQAAIKLDDDFLRATFLDTFGDPVTNPKGWKVKKLKEISTKILSGSTPLGGKKVYVDEGVIFFRSQNVWRNRLLLEDIAYIDTETHLKMKKSSLKNKDILMTKTGRINTENSSLGRAAMFLGKNNSANINGHVYLIRLQEDIVHEYVLYILTTDEYREHIRSVCVGGIDKRQINKEHLEKFPIIFPPLDLQHRFATIVETVEQQKARQRQNMTDLDTLFASLTQRAFRGEL